MQQRPDARWQTPRRRRRTDSARLRRNPNFMVSHLMLDRLAWVDGRHQAVLVWTTWVALDEPGLRCYQEAVETDKVGSETDCMGRG